MDDSDARLLADGRPLRRRPTERTQWRGNARAIRRGAWPLAALSLQLVAASAFAQSLGSQGGTINGSVLDPPVLKVGPIDGLTTGWHPSPELTSVPLGTRLDFAVHLPDGVVADGLRWFGVDDEAEGASHASVSMDTPGDHRVRVDVQLSSGMWTGESVYRAVDVPSDKIEAIAPDLWVKPHKIDTSLPVLESNQETVLAFMGDESIADLIELAPRTFATSIARTLRFHVETSPPGFEPLMEWRLDEQPFGLGKHKGSVNEIGSHEIAVGPPERAKTLILETYRTIITHHNPQDTFDENPVLAFSAVTEPPGFEHLVRWISSTKYGQATPLSQHGSSFVAHFTAPWGPDSFLWLGVRANEAKVGADGKGTTPCDPPNCDDGDPCTLDACFEGTCSNTPINCDDRDPCTTDSCSGGTCNNTLINCDDGNVCTTDYCDIGQCQYEPDPSYEKLLLCEPISTDKYDLETLEQAIDALPSISDTTISVQVGGKYELKQVCCANPPTTTNKHTASGSVMANFSTKFNIPGLEGKVEASFPFLADGYIEWAIGPFFKTVAKDITLGVTGSYTEAPCAEGCVAYNFTLPLSLTLGVEFTLQAMLDLPWWGEVLGVVATVVSGMGGGSISSGGLLYGAGCEPPLTVTINPVTTSVSVTFTMKYDGVDLLDFTTPPISLTIWEGTSFP